ncbi:topoisomerase DNA-binding C4 zinc finger domain-containing protein [Candidatus Roizmanbacteria bacterium]|nr:topoisomerase DNA-binding C4 zinc finger domain-containing protein [Candidatus Roizmanbacteria bacterium]
MQDIADSNNTCPRCGSPLGEIMTTKSGRQMQRCSTGSWNPTTKKAEGCPYVKWFDVSPKELDEKCPKCGSPLLLVVTRFDKRLKRCSTNKWDPQTRTSSGCDYVEWLKGTTENLNEDCPKCGNKLMLYTSASGKQLKKCSTNKWDPEERVSTGCDFVQWIN